MSPMRNCSKSSSKRFGERQRSAGDRDLPEARHPDTGGGHQYPGVFPTRYWQSGQFDKWENLSADYMQEHFEVKRMAARTAFCSAPSTASKNGRHAGLEIDGPEYETIYAIGGLNAIDSLEEVA